MTQPYGQQPGQPPGGYPQSGGFQQPPYPHQGMGGMSAPQHHGMVGGGRPGTVTAAAILAFIQAGITTITTIVVFGGLASADEGVSGTEAVLAWVVAFAQAIGVVLLIVGGIQAIGGKSRVLLVAGCALELAVCLFWAIRFAVIHSGGNEVINAGKGVLIGFAVFFAIMPVISLVLSLTGPATEYFQSRSEH